MRLTVKKRIPSITIIQSTLGRSHNFSQFTARQNRVLRRHRFPSQIRNAGKHRAVYIQKVGKLVRSELTRALELNSRRESRSR